MDKVLKQISLIYMDTILLRYKAGDIWIELVKLTLDRAMENTIRKNKREMIKCVCLCAFLCMYVCIYMCMPEYEYICLLISAPFPMHIYFPFIISKVVWLFSFFVCFGGLGFFCCCSSGRFVCLWVCCCFSSVCWGW